MLLIGRFHLLLMLLVCVDAAASIELRLSDEQRAALGVQTAPVRVAEHIAVGALPGRVVIPPAAQRVITFPFDGVVVDLFVHEGEQVAAGAPLVRIRGAAAAQASAEAQRLTSAAALARLQAERDAKLVAEGIAAARRAQESAAQATAAEAAAAAARSVIRGGRTVAGRFDEFEIVAPAAGIIQERGVAVGHEVHADTVGFTVVTSAERWVQAQAPESILAALRVGARAELAEQCECQPGRVIAVGNQIDAATRNALVRASFQNASRLLAGQTVELRVFERASESTFEVPSSAVVRHGDRNIVFVRAAGGFRVVPVTVGARVASDVAVLGELSAQDEVAVRGTSALKALVQE